MGERIAKTRERYEETTGPVELRRLLASQTFKDRLAAMSEVALGGKQEAAFAVYKGETGFAFSDLLEEDITECSSATEDLETDPFIRQARAAHAVNTLPLVRRELNVATATRAEILEGEDEGRGDLSATQQVEMEGLAKEFATEALRRDPTLNKADFKRLEELMLAHLHKKHEGELGVDRDDIAMLIHCHPAGSGNKPSSGDLEGYSKLREENTDLIEGIVAYQPRGDGELRLFRVWEFMDAQPIKQEVILAFGRGFRFPKSELAKLEAFL